MDEADQKEILGEMDKEDAVNIRNLMTFAEDTAGGLMNTEVIKVMSEMSKKQAIDQIIIQSEEIEEFYSEEFRLKMLSILKEQEKKN